MKRYKKYVYYITIDHYHIRPNLKILNLENNTITLFVPLFRSKNPDFYPRKRLGVNFLRYIETQANPTHVPRRRTTRLFNEESRDIRYRKLVKKIKNYKRDWWKGDMERTIRKLEYGVLYIGGV